MIVIDASVLVELLTDVAGESALARDVLLEHDDWAAPDHAVTEAAHALRGLWMGGRLDDDAFDQCMRELATLELLSFSVAPLLPRMRELAANMTAYDSAYVALAEVCGVAVITRDRKWTSVPGVRAEVRVLGEG